MSNINIHPTAVIADGAKIADSAKIGPYCVIGADVTIGAGSELKAHVNVDGVTSIGENNIIFPFTSLGTPPQDLKFKGERSELVIGDNNTIREHVTMNAGTEGGGLVTKVGNNCFIMVGSHVAHDCQLGDHVIMANNATLAGHVNVGDHAIIGGLAAVHQFVRIGEHAMIGGLSGVEHDVIPFGSVMGERANLAGLNLIGLKRRGFDREAIHALRTAYKDIFNSADGTLAERTKTAATDYQGVDAVSAMTAFIQAESKRQICVPAQAGAETEAA